MLLCGFAPIALWAMPAPYNSPIIDGTIGSDWDTDDIHIIDSSDDSPWAGNEIYGMWITWDSENLYIAVDYTLSANGLSVYVDAEEGGTVDFRADDGWTGAWPRDVTSDKPIDLFLGSWSGAPFDIYNANEDNSTDIGAYCHSATGELYNAEALIPWDIVFTGGFPIGAKINIACLLVGGDNSYAGDALPDQPDVGDDEGPDNLTNFETISLDSDSNGIPDYQGTYIAGSVSFSDIDDPPFPVVNIYYQNPLGEDYFSSSSTDDGSWAIYGLSTGDTLSSILFSSPGYRDSSIFNALVTEPPNDTFHIEMTAYDGVIHGEIIPATVCSIYASFTDTEDSSAYIISDWSDSSGQFILDHLKSGQWDISVFPQNPDYMVTSIESISVNEIDTTYIEIYLDAASVLREWNDPVGDDYGPGTYTYPTDPVFMENAFDIISIRIKDLESSHQIEFDIELGNLPPSEIVDWAPYYPPVNLQKLDIYIDTHSGGSSQGLPNRRANFVDTDLWDFAISADGWWIGLFASNGQSIDDNYTQNVTDIHLSADTSTNIVRITLNKSAFTDHLGDANFDEFQYWDFIVLSLGHDGNGVEGVRTVNAGSASQWQFGGGAEGNNDPNIIDMAYSAGLDRSTDEPKEDPPSQETQLDWITSSEPLVQLAAHLPIDLTPPTIDFATDYQLTHMKGTHHLLFPVIIEDNVEVAEAKLYYKIDSDWEVVSMGATDWDNIWFGDIPIDEPIDSTDNIATSLEFYFKARDREGNLAIFPDDGDTNSPDYPFAIDSDNPSRTILPPISLDSLVKIFYSGLPESDSLIWATPIGDRIAFEHKNLIDFPAIPASLIIRYPYENEIDGIDTDSDLARLLEPKRSISISGSDRSLPINLRLHWLEDLTADIDDQSLTLVEFGGNISSPRPYGGTLYSGSSIICGNVFMGEGLWGLGEDIRDSKTEKTLSEIDFSPNPFSPNDDGIYDKVAISWFAGEDGSMDIDIYSLNGDHIKELEQNLTVKTGRSKNIWWDGRNETGRLIRAGIYIVRFEFTYISNGVELRTRENKSLVIIK